MSKLWIKKWKEYVNYAFIKRNIQYSYYYSQYNNKKYEPKLDSPPGIIENKSLVVPLENFLNDGDVTNPDNMVIRHDINQKGEVKIVNKVIWDFFNNKYGSDLEIKKGLIEEKSRFSTMPKKIVELYFRKVKIIFL